MPEEVTPSLMMMMMMTSIVSQRNNLRVTHTDARTDARTHARTHTHTLNLASSILNFFKKVCTQWDNIVLFSEGYRPVNRTGSPQGFNWIIL